jgi:hypothetical protein
VQSRRAPAFINTCHDVRFAPHVGDNVMRGNALVFEKHLSKMPQEPALRNTCQKHLSGTTSSRTTTGAAPELNPPKSACAGDAVLRTSNRGTVPMGQCDGCHRRQCTFLQMTYTAETPHADGRLTLLKTRTQMALPRPEHAHAPELPSPRPPRHVPRTHYNRMAGRQMSCRQQSAPPQSRCSKDVTTNPHLP